MTTGFKRGKKFIPTGNHKGSAIHSSDVKNESIKLAQQKKLDKVKCAYKKFHCATSKYPDYCHYCGWSPKVIK